jgi:hypothetical protein
MSRCWQRVEQRPRKPVVRSSGREHAARNRAAIRHGRMLVCPTRIVNRTSTDAQRIAENVEGRRTRRDTHCNGTRHSLKDEHIGRDQHDKLSPGLQDARAQQGTSGSPL